MFSLVFLFLARIFLSWRMLLPPIFHVHFNSILRINFINLYSQRVNKTKHGAIGRNGWQIKLKLVAKTSIDVMYPSSWEGRQIANNLFVEIFHQVISEMVSVKEFIGLALSNFAQVEDILSGKKAKKNHTNNLQMSKD